MAVRAQRGGTGTGVGYRAPWAACCAILFITGCYIGLLGPVLPDIARRTGVSLGDAGAVFTALFATGVFSNILTGRALDQLGRRRPFVFGLAVEGAALALIPFVSWWPALLAVFVVVGFGDAATIIAAHVLTSDLHPGDEASALNRLNVYFGVGAVAGPALGALVRAAGGSALTLYVPIGLAQLALALVILRAALPAPMHHQETEQSGGTAGAERPLRSPLMWTLAGLLLVYVGVEIGLGGWAFTFAREGAGMGDTAATLLSAGFWLALAGGRLASPLVLRRHPPVALLIGGPLLAGAGTLALVLAGSSPVVLVVGVLVAGFGFGPVWPVVFALVARAFPRAAGGASGLLGATSSVGGLVLPWAQGRVLDAGGSRAGIAVTLGGCAVLVVLAAITRRKLPAEPPADAW